MFNVDLFSIEPYCHGFSFFNLEIITQIYQPL